MFLYNKSGLSGPFAPEIHMLKVHNKVLKINLKWLWLVTNQYSDLNINLKDSI